MIKIDQYTVMQVEEYNGTFSLVEGWEGRDGDFKARWIKEEFGKDKIEKSLPKKIRIGKSRDEAIQNLKMAIAYLQGQPTPQGANHETDVPDYGEPPF